MSDKGPNVLGEIHMTSGVSVFDGSGFVSVRASPPDGSVSLAGQLTPARPGSMAW